MADIRKHLKDQGMTDEQIAAVDPALLNHLVSLATQAEEGITAREVAQKIKSDLEANKSEWNKYVLESDSNRAKAVAEVEKQRAYLKAMKEAGYPVPDAYLDGSGDPKPAAAPADVPKPASPDYDSKIYEGQRINLELISLSNKYRKLTGGEELDPVSEYEDFSKNRRPTESLRTYLDRKYDMTAKEDAKRKETEQKRLDDYAAEKVRTAKAEWQQTNGANPETRNPRATKFDVIRTDENRAQSWNRARADRTADKVDRARIEKYANTIQ